MILLSAIQLNSDYDSTSTTPARGSMSSPNLDEDDLAAIEASRDRAADHMTVDWGEEDEVDCPTLSAI